MATPLCLIEAKPHAIQTTSRSHPHPFIHESKSCTSQMILNNPHDSSPYWQNGIFLLQAIWELFILQSKFPSFHSFVWSRFPSLNFKPILKFPVSWTCFFEFHAMLRPYACNVQLLIEAILSRWVQVALLPSNAAEAESILGRFDMFLRRLWPILSINGSLIISHARSSLSIPILAPEETEALSTHALATFVASS